MFTYTHVNASPTTRSSPSGATSAPLLVFQVPLSSGSLQIHTDSYRDRSMPLHPSSSFRSHSLWVPFRFVQIHTGTEACSAHAPGMRPSLCTPLKESLLITRPA